MRAPSLFAALAAVSVLVPIARGDIIFVKAACDGPQGDGSSWAGAFCAGDGLHAALAQAQPGDELWVAQGVYTPAGPGGDRTVSFQIPSGVSIYGGFAGDETSRDQRNPDAFETVFSGDLNRDDIRDMIPFPTNPWENAFHVLVFAGADAGTLIDGCTIASGFSSGSRPLRQDRGGNIYMTSGSLTVRDCTIRYGYAESNGGGISAQNGELTVEGALFLGNSASDRGGAVAVYDGASATITACEFRENIGGFGCALFVGDAQLFDPPTQGASVELADSLFIDNIGLFGASSGGAIMINYGDLLAYRCDFIDNEVPGGGGAIYSVANSVRFEACRFFGNTAPGDGGAVIYADGNNSVAPPMPTTLTNCLMVGNNGVAVAIFDGIAEFVGCTMANNTVSIPFLGWPTFLTQNESTLRIHNSIVWGNDPFGDSVNTDGEFVIVGHLDPVLDIKSSIIEGWDGSLPGTAQAIDPVFVDPAGLDGLLGTPDDDLRLATVSPAIDAGDTALLPDDAADLDGDGDTAEPAPRDLSGHDRVIGAQTDLGAYESQSPPCPADLNGDGMLNFFDVSAYLSAFGAGDPAADFTGDGELNFFDVSAFLSAFRAGCP